MTFDVTKAHEIERIHFLPQCPHKKVVINKAIHDKWKFGKFLEATQAQRERNPDITTEQVDFHIMTPLRWKELEKIVYYCAESCKALKRIEFTQKADLEDVHYIKKKKGGGGGDLEMPRNTGFKSIELKCFPQFKNALMFYTWLLRGSCDSLVELDLTHNRDVQL